jgi:hypothetical protein
LDADFDTALFAAVAQDPAAPDRFHAAAKTMDLLAFPLVGLKCSFHEREPVPLLKWNFGEKEG